MPPADSQPRAIVNLHTDASGTKLKFSVPSAVPVNFVRMIGFLNGDHDHGVRFTLEEDRQQGDSARQVTVQVIDLPAAGELLRNFRLAVGDRATVSDNGVRMLLDAQRDVQAHR